MEKLFDVIYEDHELLVLNKPAGLVCHPTKGDEYSSLISRLRLYTGDGVKTHLVNRLDRETSGLVIVAKNTKFAGVLGKAIESREVAKEYLAIVHGHMREASGIVDAPLGKDEKSEVAIKDTVRGDGSASRTLYSVMKRFNREEGNFSLLSVLPATGRKHQIRIHMQYLGHPIVGDKLYGGDPGVYLSFVRHELTAEQARKLMVANQALHAHKLKFKLGENWVTFEAPPEPWFTQFHTPTL